MGWITLSLRRNELQTSIQNRQYELLQISNQMRRLSNYANAVGDGTISPAEIASLGTDLFGEGMAFMEVSNMAADEAALLQCQEYETLYGNITQQQYANAGGALTGTTLYFDETTGGLNYDRLYQDFYQEALEDFVNTTIMPKLKELETELQNEKTQIETEIQAEEAELQTVKESISQSIQDSAIQL